VWRHSKDRDVNLEFDKSCSCSIVSFFAGAEAPGQVASFQLYWVLISIEKINSLSFPYRLKRTFGPLVLYTGVSEILRFRLTMFLSS
jgi:hypothetical protein